RSAHLFFEGALFGEAADGVMLEVVAPVVEAGRREGTIERFFVVRYDVGGPHIRFRFHGPGGGAKAAGAEHRLRRLTDERSDLVREVRWEPYEPEVARYGGAEGVAASEEVFWRSSKTALALLRKVPSSDRPARLGKALLAQMVLLHAFEPERERAARLAGAFADAYLRQRAPDPDRQARWVEEYRRGMSRQADRLAEYVDAAWAALEAGDPLTAELDSFCRHLASARDRLRRLAAEGRLRDGAGNTDWPSCVRWLLPSYLHLMHNRLGVSLREECYLAVLAYSTLGGEAFSVTAPAGSAHG
ncbi:MAG: thiopeptide-type bacteriocin biosynthesis protein, partial [Holophagales bacterium]|nr:thiopeptide-type bacteriocin biosynthesis protein [Holophagales bacterium]